MLIETSAPRQRESRADHTKKLLEAAYQLVPKVGVAGLRTRDIAKEAGVHLATFHYCFESKDALVRSLYDYVDARFQAAIEKYIIPFINAKDRLEGHRAMRKYLLEEDRHLLIAWRAFQMEAWINPKVADLIRPAWRLMRERLYPSIQIGTEEGLFKNLPTDKPNVAAAIILGLYDSGLMQMFLDPEDIPLDQFEAGLQHLYGESTKA